MIFFLIFKNPRPNLTKKAPRGRFFSNSLFPYFLAARARLFNFLTCHGICLLSTEDEDLVVTENFL